MRIITFLMVLLVASTGVSAYLDFKEQARVRFMQIAKRHDCLAFAHTMQPESVIFEDSNGDEISVEISSKIYTIYKCIGDEYYVRAGAYPLIEASR